VEVPDHLWKEVDDPARVNTWIRRRLEQLENQSISENEQTGAAADAQPAPLAGMPEVNAIPPQASVATQFAPTADGRIDLAPDPPGHSPLADAIQREQYLEVRHKALDLAGLGHNQLGDTAGSVDRLLTALPENIEAASIGRLWSRANTLRCRLEASDDADANAGDMARLPPLVVGMLRDLVETYNVFIIGDPKGRELDQIRLGPQELGTAKAIAQAALPIVEALKASVRIATADAVSVLAEQSEAAKIAPIGVHGDQAVVLAGKTSSNFVAELLRLAYAPIRKLKAEAGFAFKEVRAGAYRAVGAEFYSHNQEIIAFVFENAASLRVFVAHAFDNPALTRIIEIIVQAWR
jgi:hypothetical protein